MLKYHFMRNNVAHEEAFLARQGAHGYMLRRIRGSRYCFERPDADAHYNVTLRLTPTPTVAAPRAERVVTMQVSREMFYHVIYSQDERAKVTTRSNATAVEQYHTYMLDAGAKQEWKGGVGLFGGLILMTGAVALAQVAGVLGSLPVRAIVMIAGVALAAAGLRGIFIGLRNSIGSVHPKRGTANGEAR